MSLIFGTLVQFVTNVNIVTNNTYVINAYGEGPIRLLEDDNGDYRLVVVDGEDVVSTLFKLPSTLVKNDTDAHTPIFNLTDER